MKIPQQTKRRALITGALAMALPSWATAQSRGYPNKPIRMIVPSASGGSPDTLARIFAQKLSESMGQSVVVEALPGASGLIGTEKAMKAPADGYTILYGFNQRVTMNPHQFAKMPYDVDKDMVPVSLVAHMAYVWIAPPSFPANSMAELIQLAKAQPGKINFASPGLGSGSHLGGELLMQAAGIEMLHIPYKSTTTATLDLLAGIVQLKMDPYASAMPLIKSGKVKALAVTGPTRSTLLPQVPTVLESLPGYEIPGWHAVWVPAGTPPDIVRRLNNEFVKITRSPEIRSRLAEMSIEAVGSTPGELVQATRSESKMWGDLLKTRQIKLE